MDNTMRKVRDMYNAMEHASFLLIQWQLDWFDDDVKKRLDDANKELDNQLLLLSPDFELYKILSMFYDYHMQEFKRVKKSRNGL